MHLFLEKESIRSWTLFVLKDVKRVTTQTLDTVFMELMQI
jgi:hypothetical protein